MIDDDTPFGPVAIQRPIPRLTPVDPAPLYEAIRSVSRIFDALDAAPEAPAAPLKAGA